MSAWCGTPGQALGRPKPFISLCTQVPASDLAEVGGRMISLRYQLGIKLPLLCLAAQASGPYCSLILGGVVVFSGERQWSNGRTRLPEGAP